MSRNQIFAGVTVAVGLVSLAHAAVTWPPRATAAFFVGGAALAFVAEAVVIALGWLEHHIGPKVLGVPLYVLFGWTGAVYISYRAALVVTDGWTAVVLCGLLATTYDLATDHQGVAEGHWTYTDDLPGPRLREVPWWNFVGWLVISTATAGMAALVL